MRDAMLHQLFARTALVLGALVVLGSSAPATASEGQKKHNIVFILADDMRRDTIAALGNKYIATPNLDKLVKRGTAFTRAYIQGSMSGAVCMPSRAMIMTGRSFFKTPLDMKGQLVLGELLRQAGYVTIGLGKWHNGTDSWLRSFELGNTVLFGGMADHFDVPFQAPAGGSQFKKVDAKGRHSSEVIADAAIAFIKSQTGKGEGGGGGARKPFFLYVAFTAPHDPRDAPDRFRQMYYKNKPPLPKNFLPQHPFDNGELVGRDENLAPWPRTKEVIQDQLAEYYALITHLDEQIGRLLQALEESGELENTIIVFAGDNGLALGSHGLVGKQNVYDHSVGVPLLFAGPGVPKDQRRDALVYLLDVFPTLCELNGLDMPKNLDGKSLVKVMTGEQAQVRDSLYFNYKNLQRAAYKDGWKLICYPQINHQQLFDLKNDPDEINNLAGDPANAKRIEELRALILRWEKDLGLDAMPLTVANPKAMQVDLTGKDRKPDQWQPEWIRKKYFGK
jgi:arylsulfatase A-like enzyme